MPDELCATCHSTRKRSDLSMEEFIAAGPVRARHCGEVICSAGGCPRPVRTRQLRLCHTHEHRRKQLGLPLADFLQHPRAEPLPSFGPCRVVVCTRQAHARRGLCRAHDVRWREQHRAGTLAVTDFGAWCRSSAPVASGHEVILRGLAPLVQAEILLGLQERCRQGALTYLYQLRIICRRLLGIHAPTITGFDVSRLARHHRALAAGPAAGGAASGDVTGGGAAQGHLEHRRARSWPPPGHRLHRHLADLAPRGPQALGRRGTAHPAGRPRHAILQDHVHRIGELSASLRLHRDDHGDDPPATGPRRHHRVPQPAPAPPGHRPDVIVAPLDDLPSGRHDPAGVPGSGPDPAWPADVRAAR